MANSSTFVQFYFGITANACTSWRTIVSKYFFIM